MSWQEVAEIQVLLLKARFTETEKERTLSYDVKERKDLEHFLILSQLYVKDDPRTNSVRNLYELYFGFTLNPASIALVDYI